MKFEETLKSHLTAEWRSQYIVYGDLKEILEEYKSSAAACSDIDLDEKSISREYSKFKEKFFLQIESELQKVNTFFEEQLNANNRKLRQLNIEAERSKKDLLEKSLKSSSKTDKSGYVSGTKENNTTFTFNRNNENNSSAGFWNKFA